MMLKKTGSKASDKDKEKSSKKSSKSDKKNGEEKKDLKIDLETVKAETVAEKEGEEVEQEERFVSVGESDIKFLKEYGIISAENEKLIWEFFSSGLRIFDNIFLLSNTNQLKLINKK